MYNGIEIPKLHLSTSPAPALAEVTNSLANVKKVNTRLIWCIVGVAGVATISIIAYLIIKKRENKI